MFAKILGLLWAVLGLLWLFKPQSLRERIKKKMARKIKWIVLGFVVVFAFSIIGSIIKAEELYLKIIGAAALMVAARLILLATTKTSEKIFSWWEGRPLIFFRFCGLFVLITGAALFLS